QNPCVLNVDSLRDGRLTVRYNAEIDLPRIDYDIRSAVGRNSQGGRGHVLRTDRDVNGNTLVAGDPARVHGNVKVTFLQRLQNQRVWLDRDAATTHSRIDLQGDRVDILGL